MASSSEETGSLSIDIGGRAVPVRLKHNPRARRYIVRVDPARGDVVVTSPSRRSFSKALRFAESQSGWIADRLGAVQPAIPFADGECVPFQGKAHVIESRPQARRGVWRALNDAATPRICVSGDPDFLQRRLTDWFKKEARHALATRIAEHEETLGLKAARLSVRDQTSRWGSCSSGRVLSFSWRLILAPPPVLDYVAAHEVAHLKEMNHSARFWRLVEHACPGHEDARAWLAEHGPALHRIGALR